LPGTYLRAYSKQEETTIGVGTRVAANTTIWTKATKDKPRVRLAYRHDEGVVMDVHQRGYYLVKFDPVLSTRATGETTLVSSYRTGRVRSTALSRVVTQDAMSDLSSFGRKSRGKAFFDIIARREKSKATTEDELMNRILRLRQLLSSASLETLEADVLVKEGFLKERELAMLLEGMVSDRKIMKYPWSHIPQKYQRLLLTAGTPDQAVTRVMNEDRIASAPASRRGAEAQRRLLRSVALWGRSQRRLIRVSEASQETLFNVAVQRASLGLPVCHWNYLSAPGGSMVEFGEGIMFQWDGFQSAKANHTITFGSPLGIFLGESLEFVWWRLDEADDQWWDEGYSHVWKIVNTPYYMRRMAFEDDVSEAIRDLQVQAAQEGAPITRAQAAEAVLLRPRFKLVHMSINLIAALHNFHHDVVKVQQKTRAKQRRSLKSGDLRSIFQINLDDEGLSTWAQTWCVEMAERESQSGSHGGHSGSGEVSLHKRVGHMCPVWVLRKNVKAHEKVLQTRMGGPNKQTEYCKVNRPRVGCWAGKGKLKANESRIRMGRDDLDVRTPMLAVLPSELGEDDE
jgi:hypothetical protein